MRGDINHNDEDKDIRGQWDGRRGEGDGKRER